MNIKHSSYTCTSVLSLQNVREKVEGEKYNMLAMYTVQGITQQFGEENMKLVYDTLFEKMLNLRKKHMQKSWDRIQKKGGKSTQMY